jgi:hypothetical protein
VIKNPKHLDKVLTAVLAKKCTGTGNVYRWAENMNNDRIVAEFTDGDVEILVHCKSRDIFMVGGEWVRHVVRQLLVAHGEIKVPGQL